MCCADFDQEGRPLQLRDVAALLRKGDDPHAVLRGLRVIGPLIEAAPEELSHTAGEARKVARESVGLLSSACVQAVASTVLEANCRRSKTSMHTPHPPTAHTLFPIQLGLASDTIPFLSA